MLDLRPYASTGAKLADFLPWAALIAPGIILNKDGSFQRSFRFRGPALESATEALAHAGTFNNNVLTMSARIAGLRDIYTAEAALALNTLGDSMRKRLNALCRAQGVALQFTGVGSLMNLQATAHPIAHIDDTTEGDPRIRDLFFFHMLEAGVYVARRGFTVLSLPIRASHVDKYVQAFEAFVQRYRDLIGTAA